MTSGGVHAGHGLLEHHVPVGSDLELLAFLDLLGRGQPFEVVHVVDSRQVGLAERLRVLEVGAINTELLHHPELATRAIDLRSSAPGIEAVDFFSLPGGGPFDAASGVSVPYDAVVCSMVINCVPEPRRAPRVL